jgi:hypothetical protein
MLSFQIVRDGKTIQIDCDNDGIDLLIDTLLKLKGSGSHVHLCAPSHGGIELSDLTPHGASAISEVIVSHGGD